MNEHIDYITIGALIGFYTCFFFKRQFDSLVELFSRGFANLLTASNSETKEQVMLREVLRRIEHLEYRDVQQQIENHAYFHRIKHLEDSRGDHA